MPPTGRAEAHETTAFRCCPSFSPPPLVPTTACSLHCPSLVRSRPLSVCFSLPHHPHRFPLTVVKIKQVKPSFACDLRHRIRSPPRNSSTFLYGPPLTFPVTRTMIYQSSDAPPLHRDSHNIGPKPQNKPARMRSSHPLACAFIPSSPNQIPGMRKQRRTVPSVSPVSSCAHPG